ncbi:Uncharacterised protein [Mycobacteroides abscessus subsp. massiliense]|nr:Uncharacterised protein [Mycobacteroides abscessus subsp. massiliense]SKH90296.1 Uncharacterised protein [Mycobacteroides abscessus subsp. massiliense]SKK83670.1 Uncharacterised protein [Mycobacteroides abscessus subsp. massiliense]SKK90114.1 Uncharacterised protein [Mycobacteroides abscessus subsp. massiliense]
MGEAADEWQGRVDTTDEYIDRIIAAANSIPEGPPVGTIARRPDGVVLAHKDGDGWKYWLLDAEQTSEMVVAQNADSWPVIYDPTGKTLDELHVEIDRLDKAEDSALRERDYWEETVNRILYTCSSEDEIGEWSSANDPVERFIEQFKPVKRIDPTAQQEPTREPFKCPCCKLVFGAGTDRIEVCDLCVASHPITTRDASQTQQEPGEIDCRNCDGRKCMGCVFREHPHDCADDCPECCEPRTPRVVDRLGVDEQGSRWRNRVDTEFWFQDKYWNFRTKDGCTSWFAAGYEPKMCIFTEVFDVG